MMGRWITGSGWYPNFRKPQLFRKGAMRYRPEPVHEGYELLTGQPRNAIHQVPFRDLDEIIVSSAPLLAIRSMPGAARRSAE